MTNHGEGLRMARLFAGSSNAVIVAIDHGLYFGPLPGLIDLPKAIQALDGADVVCTCTSARTPIVRRAWLADGAHVNAVGGFAPGAELDPEVVAAAGVFVDRRESALNEAGGHFERALQLVREEALPEMPAAAELSDLFNQLGRIYQRTDQDDKAAILAADREKLLPARKSNE